MLIFNKGDHEDGQGDDQRGGGRNVQVLFQIY